MDNVLLTKIVRGLGENLTDVEINIGYTVKDPRPHQLKMLERAVKDATEKAKIMATAAGCSLGLVKSIDYSEQEIHFYSQARNIGCAEDAAVCMENSLDITPEDLVGGESVTERNRRYASTWWTTTMWMPSSNCPPTSSSACR